VHPQGGAMAAARARERALAERRGGEDDDDDEEEGDMLISNDLDPMLDEDGNPFTFPFLKRIVMTDWFNNFIVVIVIIAGILVGLQTSKHLQGNAVILMIDTIILIIFVAEAVLKIMAEFPKPWRYLADVWNVLDFVIVVVGVVDLIVSATGGGKNGGNALMVLRLFRLMRIMKLVKAFPGLRVIVETTIESLPSVCYVSLLIFLLLYIYAVLGVFLFGPNDQKNFGSLGVSLVTLFRVMTLDHWSEVLYIQIHSCAREYTEEQKRRFGCDEPSKDYYLSVIFFISLVMLVTYLVLNLFIGVVTSSYSRALKDAQKGRGEEEEHPSDSQIATMVTNLYDDLMECRQDMTEIRNKLALILKDQNS